MLTFFSVRLALMIFERENKLRNHILVFIESHYSIPFIFDRIEQLHILSTLDHLFFLPGKYEILSLILDHPNTSSPLQTNTYAKINSLFSLIRIINSSENEMMAFAIRIYTNLCIAYRGIYWHRVNNPCPRKLVWIVLSCDQNECNYKGTNKKIKIKKQKMLKMQWVWASEINMWKESEKFLFDSEMCSKSSCCLSVRNQYNLWPIYQSFNSRWAPTANQMSNSFYQ